jgi:hypothetical protein
MLAKLAFARSVEDEDHQKPIARGNAVEAYCQIGLEHKEGFIRQVIC